MTDVLASIRPDSWNFPLFLHVLGAMVLMGAVAAAVVTQLAPVASSQADTLRRFSFRTLLFVALPGYVVMWAGSQWIHSKEFGDSSSDPAWIGIGFATREGGGVLLLISLICAGIASRRSSSGLAKASGIVAAIALAAWVVAVWAMGAKPG